MLIGVIIINNDKCINIIIKFTTFVIICRDTINPEYEPDENDFIDIAVFGDCDKTIMQIKEYLRERFDAPGSFKGTPAAICLQNVWGVLDPLIK